MLCCCCPLYPKQQGQSNNNKNPTKMHSSAKLSIINIEVKGQRLFALSWTKEKDEIKKKKILMEARHGVVWAIFSLWVRTMTTHYTQTCLVLAQIIDSTKMYHLIDGNRWVESGWSADKIRNSINFALSGQFTYLRRDSKINWKLLCVKFLWGIQCSNCCFELYLCKYLLINIFVNIQSGSDVHGYGYGLRRKKDAFAST